MSATAFQRMRRERIAKMRAEAEKQQGNQDYNSKTKGELKTILDEKGIEYDAKAKKEDLIALLAEPEGKQTEHSYDKTKPEEDESNNNPPSDDHNEGAE